MFQENHCRIIKKRKIKNQNFEKLPVDFSKNENPKNEISKNEISKNEKPFLEKQNNENPRIKNQNLASLKRGD